MTAKRIVRNGLTIAILLTMTAVPTASVAADWPQWRGPNRDAKSTETGLLAPWPDNGPALLWANDQLGDGYSGPAVKGDRAFTLGATGDTEYVHSLDMNDGKILWSVKHGKRFQNDKGDGPRGTPVVEGDAVYALGASGDLTKLAAADGKTLWHTNILKQFKVSNIHWGLSESPLIEGDLLIVMPGAKKASVVAFDKNSGKLVWKTDDLSYAAGYASAVAADIDGTRQIVHFTHNAAVGIDAKNGKLLWRYAGANNRTANVATPIVHGNNVFVSSAYGTGSGLVKIANGKAEEVYFTKNLQNHHGGIVLHEGYIYGFSSKALVCLEFETGKEMWNDRSVGKGSLVYADGHLYCLGEKGVMGLVEANPEKYVEKSRFPFKHSKFPQWTHPVIVDGKLLLRDQQKLFCYDIKK